MYKFTHFVVYSLNHRSTEEKADTPAPSKPKSLLSAEDQKTLYKRLEKYDDWTYADYEAHREQDVQTDGVLTYFSMPDDPNDWYVVS